MPRGTTKLWGWVLAYLLKDRLIASIFLIFLKRKLSKITISSNKQHLGWDWGDYEVAHSLHCIALTLWMRWLLQTWNNFEVVKVFFTRYSTYLGMFWCCGNHFSSFFSSVIVIWFVHCLLSFESFVIRHWWSQTMKQPLIRFHKSSHVLCVIML